MLNVLVCRNSCIEILLQGTLDPDLEVVSIVVEFYIGVMNLDISFLSVFQYVSSTCIFFSWPEIKDVVTFGTESTGIMVLLKNHG